MVYVTEGADRTFVSSKPVKTKHVQSASSKEISSYMKMHKISVQTNPSGEIVVKSTGR